MTYPPQPSGQQDPYGQYGQQPPGQYGPPPGGPPPGGPPPKRKRGVIIAIVVVGVLVLAGVGVTVYLLTKSDNPTTSAPNETGTTTGSTGTGNPGGGGDAASLSAAATKYVDAVNGADEAAAKAVMCDSATPGVLYEENAGKGDVRTGDAELISKTAGVVSITLADSNALAVPLAFEFTDGAWCVQF